MCCFDSTATILQTHWLLLGDPAFLFLCPLPYLERSRARRIPYGTINLNFFYFHMPIIGLTSHVAIENSDDKSSRAKKNANMVVLMTWCCQFPSSEGKSDVSFCCHSVVFGKVAALALYSPISYTCWDKRFSSLYRFLYITVKKYNLYIKVVTYFLTLVICCFTSNIVRISYTWHVQLSAQLALDVIISQKLHYNKNLM